MRKRLLNARGNSSHIYVGNSGRFDTSLCEGIEPLMVVDEGFYREHPQYVSSGTIEIIPSGEVSKSLKQVEDLYHCFKERRLERGSLVIACGGGVASDVVGFAAATYLRGIRFGVVATTLLAQVDASIGGKNGINFEGIKNSIGTIRQPEFCICDVALLGSLDESTLREGFAEAIKHALIANADLFTYLEENTSALCEGSPAALEQVVWESVNIKATIVERDEFEAGERRKLNFGHTVGHALEAVLGISHGQAVAAGMEIEARLSLKRGMISETEYQRILRLLKQYNFTEISDFKPDDLLDAMSHDKKIISGKVLLPLLEGIGACRIEALALEEIRGVL